MRIVIVGDREDEAATLQALCAEQGHDVRFAADAAGCLDVHADGSPDLVFLSASAFEGRVVALVASMRRCLDTTAVTLITDDSAVRETVSAIRAGATVLRRPVEAEQVRRILRDVASHAAVPRRRPDVATLAPALRETLHGPEVQQLLDLVASVASATAPVLVMGGPGVGSDLVADLLHVYSPRASRPFVKVTCASITPDLIESEALFDVARGGTLLLDEVADLSERLQARLLRALDGRVRPMAEARDIDVRVIATTSVDLLAAVRAGVFREDLYFRLTTLNLTVPACLDRPDDVLALSLRLRAVRRHDPAGEPEPAAPPARLPAFKGQTLASVEHRALREALSRTSGNTQAAADMLGIQRRTLYRKLRKHHLIEPPPVRRAAAFR
jgi:DNA-binding NtrC family response regulator